jgi:S-adenosylmethionine hydrolase
MIFVANLEEAESSRVYIGQAKKTAPLALWEIHRTGHVNVNSAERLAAMRALLEATTTGSLSSMPDGTIEMRPASDAVFNAASATGTIRQMRPLYGNIYTSFVESDLMKLGIKIGSQFSLTKGEQSVVITFAKAYSDVPLKAWVAFIDSEGHVQLSRNYENAAETINAQIGDKLMITPK